MGKTYKKEAYNAWKKEPKAARKKGHAEARHKNRRLAQQFQRGEWDWEDNNFEEESYGVKCEE